MTTVLAELDRPGIEADLSSPGVAGLLQRHPELGEEIVAVTVAAAAVRRFVGRPRRKEDMQPFPSRDLYLAEVELNAALEALEGSAEAPEPEPGETVAALRRLARALARLRVFRHAFDSPGFLRPRPEAVALAAAARDFVAAYEALLRKAGEHGLARLPWVLELATHVAPSAAAGVLEVAGYEVPRVPVSRRPWGERCALTGFRFAVDSRRSPELRYRSLEGHSHTLTAGSYHLVRRARRVLEVLRGAHGEVIAEIAAAFPFLFEDYLADGGHPSLVRFGLTDFPNLAVVLNNLLRAYQQRPLFGSRSGGRYSWVTYGQIRARALDLSRGLQAMGFHPEDRLALLPAENCTEFYLAEMAAVFADLITVSVPGSLGEQELLAALTESQVRVVALDRSWLARLSPARFFGGLEGVRCVLLFGDDDVPAELTRADSRVVSLAAVEQRGRVAQGGRATASGVDEDTPVIHGDAQGWAAARERGMVPDGNDAVHTVIFTSGSTGRPKGAVFTRRRWLREVSSEIDVWPFVAASFQPSALAADRVFVWQALCNGGRVGFARRGVGLLEDLRLLRPTVLEAPPAFWNALYAEYRATAADPEVGERAAARARVRIRGSLGGRLFFAATGGAPSLPGVRDAMEEILGIPLAEGYGTTETGRIASNGVLLPGVEVRVLDLPSLDPLPVARGFPVGELAVRTPHLTARYEGSAGSPPDSFTADGFFRTGDIVELAPGGRITILGRTRDAFKLASGEFVNPGVVERSLQGSELVEAVVVTSSPGQAGLVAVAVPVADTIDEVRLLADLQRVARRAGLRPTEVPLGVVLVPRESGRLPWTAENGLLTPSLKPNRRAIEARYRDLIDEAGAGNPPRTTESATVDASIGDDAEALGLVARVAAAVLGKAEEDFDLTRSLADLGVDSLGAVEFLLRLERVGGAKNPTGAAWQEGDATAVERPLEVLARQLAAARAPDAAVPAPLDQPGGLGPEIGDGREPSPPVGVMDARLAAEDARKAPIPESWPERSTAPGVLITGATGFLGVHLLSHLAASLPSGTPLAALVRADDHETARRRMAGAFAAANLGPHRIVIPGEGGEGIVVLAGHLERERFALAEPDYRLLAEGTGLIYHLAAAVRAGAAYDALRGANVDGTLQVLRFATTMSLKALHFVSSLNVALLVEDCLQSRAWEESSLPREIPAAVAPRHPAYALTKWVGELMIRDLFLHSAGVWPVSVSRPGLLTWAGATGFANDDDWLSRVLRSCLELGCVIADEEAGIPMAPPCTAATTVGLDLVPVDFAARAIARLGALTLAGTLPAPTRAQETAETPTFHVSNIAPDEAGLVTRGHLMDLLTAAHMEACPEAAPLRAAPATEWLSRVACEASPALPVLPMLRRSTPMRRRTAADRFAAAMGGAEACPPIDVSYLKVFVERILSLR